MEHPRGRHRSHGHGCAASDASHDCVLCSGAPENDITGLVITGVGQEKAGGNRDFRSIRVPRDNFLLRCSKHVACPGPRAVISPRTDPASHHALLLPWIALLAKPASTFHAGPDRRYLRQQSARPGRGSRSDRTGSIRGNRLAIRNAVCVNTFETPIYRI